MMKIINVRTVFLASVFLAFSLVSASADVITVNNPSFETLPASGLHQTAGCATPGCVYEIGPIPDWTNSGVSGQWQPGGPSGTSFTNYTSLPDGPTRAFTDFPTSSTKGPTISQIVSATVEDGGVYTLSVDVGHRSNDVAFTPDVGLLIGGVFYAAAGVDPGSGNWDTWTATFTGSAATAGDAIEIELSSGGGQGNFDNVVLTGPSVGSAVPEPASDGLLALGLCGLIVLWQLDRRMLRSSQHDRFESVHTF
ncbi:MAG: PEP-CTERM sorting domain-containing protein [Terriglobia bacterium]